MAYDRLEPFNDLPLLPPQKEIADDIDVLKKLVTSTRALATTNANIHRLPNPTMLVNTIALQEAQTSTAIENIFTTEDELYKAVSETLREEHIKPATKEVLRYREALWEGYKIVKEKRRIDKDCILRTFRQIKGSISGIRPAQTLTVIRRGQSEFRSGEVIYTPPRGAGLVEAKLDNMIEYLNDDTKYSTDPLLKMCIAHYQFEAIHPFSDGNGRTGRVLNLLYLVDKGLLEMPVLYLSKYIMTHKDDYYHHLSGVTQRGAWKPWILYMLEAVEKTAELTNQLVISITSQMEATLVHGRSKMKWYNKEVNEMIFSQPYIRPKLIGDLLRVTSRTTLTKYFGELVEAEILGYSKDGRDVYYINNDLIEILRG
ncbi:Fic family protein [Pedobacter sp. SAFR-022]|uniref:Fic family protein n=1 Tax=Pedobacter sp. SAFR-022 TaxID=3436861 RepID=UPI003F82131C